MNDVRAAVETLERFIAEAKQWAGERQAWTLMANVADAARDRAELFERAPLLEAKQLVYDEHGAMRPEWTGTAGDDTAAGSLRRQALRRYL